MENSPFMAWYVAGLQALISANRIASGTAEMLDRQVTNADVKEALRAEVDSAQARLELLGALLADTNAPSEPMSNEIADGIDAVADKIVDLPDPAVRDAAVIVAVQHTLHYYLSAFGNLASTAKHLGLRDQAEKLSGVVNDLVTSDRALTDLAGRVVNPAAV